MNLVLHDVLGGGGIASLRSDPQGKGYAQKLLSLSVEVPTDLVRPRERSILMDFETSISADTPGFAQNRADMLALVERLRTLEARAADLSEQRRPRFEARGQMTPRERLARLLDPGMPFLRLHSMAGYLVDSDDPDKTVPGGSVILGIGFVAGARAMIWVDDSGIKAGAIGEMTLPAILSIQALAKRQKLPLIHLVESAGANLMTYTVELWAHGGGLFRDLAQLSAMGIPTLAVLHGPSTAGGAYMPGHDRLCHRREGQRHGGAGRRGAGARGHRRGGRRPRTGRLGDARPDHRAWSNIWPTTMPRPRDCPRGDVAVWTGTTPAAKACARLRRSSL